MQYYISKIVRGDFPSIREKAIMLLKEEGFGIKTEMDVSATLKEKLGVDFKEYQILGACHPSYAYKALQAEDKLGVLLPCNVILIDQGEGNIEVAAMDVEKMMDGMANAALKEVAGEVSAIMKGILARL
jgi:uncharacterized protein (DUF302 family)